MGTAEAKHFLCRLVQQQNWRDAFYKADGKGGWRAPAVNETCCARTKLADLLDAIGAQGPDALYLRHGNDLATEIQAAGGIMTAKDLQSATVTVKDPLSIRVRPAALCSFLDPYALLMHVPRQMQHNDVLADIHSMAVGQAHAFTLQCRLPSLPAGNQSCSKTEEFWLCQIRQGK